MLPHFSLACFLCSEPTVQWAPAHAERPADQGQGWNPHRRGPARDGALCSRQSPSAADHPGDLRAEHDLQDQTQARLQDCQSGYKVSMCVQCGIRLTRGVFHKDTKLNLTLSWT